MGYLYVHSPHDGRQVKVRDQDIGRSVRDGEGRIFYVLLRSDGKGPYGSLTRAGGPDQEAAYDAMLAREQGAMSKAAQVTREVIHDASGRKRGGSGRALVAGFVLLAALALWAILLGPLKGIVWTRPPGTDTRTVTPTPSTTPSTGTTQPAPAK